MSTLIKLLNNSLLITGFVGLMMLVIEYINVLTRGTWQERLTSYPWAQYLIGAFLGGTPGCLGAFASVAMYSHGLLSPGALVTTMIATSGDEAFVMLALFPERALELTGILMVIGIVSGWLTDVVLSKRISSWTDTCKKLEIHNIETCECFPRDQIIKQWKQPSIARGVLAGVLLLFLFGIVSGSIGPQGWDWKRITLLIASTIGFFIAITVPEHFLQKHLWEHIALKHIPRIFLWTFGALIVTQLIINQLNLDRIIHDNTLSMIFIASLVGIIPESGPHLIFVTLYAKGVVPFSVLLASSIVQDGHGMLPMLAYSRKQFIMIKAINFVVGLVVGVLLYFTGWLNL